MICKERVFAKVYTDMNKYCGQMCPLECDSSEYITSTSSTQFPTDKYVGDLFQTAFIREKYPNVSKSQLKESLVSIKVFYQKLEYTEISEEPIYSVTSLLEGIGGSLGLFLGASVLSVLEVMEVLFEMMFMCYQLFANRTKKGNIGLAKKQPEQKKHSESRSEED